MNADAVKDGKFGFIVRRGYDRQWNPVDTWAVALPNGYEEWSITSEKHWGDEDLPHAEAVARLEAFIAEAQAALDALRARRETGDFK